MGKSCTLGIDIGSGSVKCLLLGTDGKILGLAIREIFTTYPESGFAEQNPEAWYQALLEATEELFENGDHSFTVEGISLSGAAHTPVLLDSDSKVIRPAILWSDQRSVDEAKWLDEEFGDQIMESCLNRPSCTWTLPQLMWLKKHEPESMNRVKQFLVGKDYIAYRLTGQFIADTGNAAGTLLWDLHKEKWNDDLVRLAGLSPESMPRHVAVEDNVGGLTPEAAQHLGLPKGIPVFAGGLDSVMELIGCGIIHSGEGMLRLGTAGGIMIVSDEAHPSPATITYPFPGHAWCSQAFTSSCATSFKWLRNLLSSADERLPSFCKLDELAKQAPLASDGLLFHPYLMGERAPYWDPKLRGSFTGVMIHHTRSHFLRSVLEGVAFSIRDCMEAFLKVGHKVESLRFASGGVQSELWRQIVVDVLGREASPTQSEDSSLGAAMMAAVSLGIFPDLETAVDKCVASAPPIVPRPGLHEGYQEAYDRYNFVREALTPIYQFM